MERPQFPESQATQRTLLRTRWVDEDNQKILNNAVYLTLMEEARHAYFSQRGQLEDGSFPFVLAQANVHYVSPGKGASEVLVETCTTHVGSSSFVQSYRISHAQTGRVWCQAEALLVSVDQDGQSCAMSAALRSALEG